MKADASRDNRPVAIGQFVTWTINSLDHAGGLPNYGSKMGVDAARNGPRKASRAAGPP